MVHGWKGRKPAPKTQAEEDEAARERANAAADLGLRTETLPAHLADLVAWGEEQDSVLKGKR